MMSNIGLRRRMRNQEDLTKVTCKLRPEECQFELEDGMFYTDSKNFSAWLQPRSDSKR